ncbi:MAG TPA: hypothetical protein VMJ10_12100 [Kofleriaceae bacterium]|nr:hypothetical protein [Kofleriaceae bacterium]
MRLVPYAALGLASAACVDPGRPLTQLGATGIYVYASDTDPLDQLPPRLEVDLDTPDCAPLASDARIVFHGMALPITQPSIADGGGCVMGQATTTLTPGAFTDTTQTIEIVDPSATWTIAFDGLYDPDLVFTTAPLVMTEPATITWQHGPPIENACFYYDDPDTTDLLACADDDDGPDNPFAKPIGNTIQLSFPLFTPDVTTLQLSAVGAYAVGGASARSSGSTGATCDGPASCSIELTVTHDIPVALVP